MKKTIGSILLAGVLVVVGLGSGWYAARQDTDTEAAGDDAAAHGPVLTPQALKNLGVTVGPAKLSTFTRTVNVQATVVDAPLNTFPVVAAIGGIVTKVHARPGRVVAKGDPLVTIARAPIPRPELSLTADILTPVTENLHESVSRLRSTSSHFRIVETELERVRKYADVLPRKTIIDLEYEFARTKQAKENAEHELERHGLSAAEIDSVRGGARAPGAKQLWRRALEENGLWGERESAILAALPESESTRAWSIAAIGELSAAGLATDELLAGLRASPPMTKHFVEVASLLLAGNTEEGVRYLAEQGALEHVVVLKAPATVDDWDVETLHVREGARVEAGATLVVLHDARTMWLRVEPVGAEMAHVARALEKKSAVVARPLVADTGPTLAGLQFLRLDAQGAQIAAPNEEVRGAAPDARSWRLRAGVRYLVAVPVQTLAQRFVIPASGVTTDGAERVVFIQDGETFKPTPVHVEYEDDEVAVIANDGAIYDEDVIALTGAFALGLALQTDSGVIDPHAGHSH